MYKIIIIGGGAGGLELATKLGNKLGNKLCNKLLIVNLQKNLVFK
jgi:NADH dehydrogenase FAD-containing subunit